MRDLKQLLKKEFNGPEEFELEFSFVLLKANRKEKAKRNKLDALNELGFHSEYEFKKEHDLENADDVNEELNNQGFCKCEGCHSYEENVGFHDAVNIRLCDDCSEIIE